MFQVISDENTDLSLTDESDTAYIHGNNDTVRGGLGGDWLATVLVGLPEAISTTLRGGEGNDTLHATLSTGFEETSPSLTATLDGGAGDDEIGIHARSSLGADQFLTARGGVGADTITIDSGYTDEEYYHGVQIRVEGGRDADVIDVSVWEASRGRTVIDGGSGGDVIRADGLVNEVYGGTGHDRIVVSASLTAEWSENTSNVVDGGSGNDSISMDASGWGATNTGHGGAGNDEMDIVASGTDLINLAYGDEGNDILNLRADAGYWGERATATNEAYGGDGRDVISASINLETVDYGDGTFSLPRLGTNIIYGDDGDDRLSARITVDDASDGDFYSELYGGAGNDRLSVRGGEGNRLEGNQGDDALLGGAGSDRLIGGQGDDYLRGRGGDDFFVFGSIRAGERDRIADFTLGEDVIDLSGIDARVGVAGDQGFAFGTRQGTGRAWIEQSSGSSSILHADNGRDVLEVVLQDGRDVGPGDYSASDFIL